MEWNWKGYGNKPHPDIFPHFGYFIIPMYVFNLLFKFDTRVIRFQDNLRLGLHTAISKAVLVRKH